LRRERAPDEYEYMPTHREDPWEHDERATWRVPMLFGGAAIVAIAAMATLAPPDAAVPLAAAPRAAAAPERPREIRVTTLRSRRVTPSVLEIWGETNAPDLATIRLRVSASRVQRVVSSEAPAVAGRFHAKAGLPPGLQGRTVTIRASVVSEE
jgi:hypothetical protein